MSAGQATPRRNALRRRARAPVESVTRSQQLIDITPDVRIASVDVDASSVAVEWGVIGPPVPFPCVIEDVQVSLSGLVQGPSPSRMETIELCPATTARVRTVLFFSSRNVPRNIGVHVVTQGTHDGLGVSQANTSVTVPALRPNGGGGNGGGDDGTNGGGGDGLPIAQLGLLGLGTGAAAAVLFG